MNIAELKETVAVPEGVTISIEGNIIKAKGPFGEATRKWNDLDVLIKMESGKVTVSSKNASKKQKRVIETMTAHVKNIISGVTKNNEYKLKICASHFPMQVSMEGNTIVVKNFFGEKIPRRTELMKDVKVVVQGDKIIVSGPDVEKVGAVTSQIEQTCRITNRDRRVFQDGIYLIEKNGKAIL